MENEIADRGPVRIYVRVKDPEGLLLLNGNSTDFTVGGETPAFAYATDTNGDFTPDADNVLFDGYFHESYVQSAPAFQLRIDGITELTSN